MMLYMYQVLEVKAANRTGPTNYMRCIRDTLTNHYSSKPVAVGGCFLIESGKAKLHVMVISLNIVIATLAQGYPCHIYTCTCNQMVGYTITFTGTHLGYL